MISLERRLVASLVLTLVIVFGLLFWASVTAVRSLSEAYVVTRLEHDSEALIAAVGLNPRGLLRLREGRIAPIYQQPLSGHYFVLAANGDILLRSRSLWDETLRPEALEPGAVKIAQILGPGTQQLLTRSVGFEKAGRRFTLLVGEDLTPMTEQIRRFQATALGLLVLVLLLVVIVQRYLLRRGFRTLDQARAEMRRVSDGEAQQVGELGPLEIRPLTTEVNRLLRQLQQRLQRSRQALGNLAHALKGPLSLLTHDLEALPLATADRQRVGARMDRITRLIERELKRARIAGDGAGQHFHPARHVPELIEAVAQLHHDRKLEITTSAMPAGSLPFDYEDMLELLGNLLDNACKWAERRVQLTLEAGDPVSITVADDGPGVADDARDALLRRGNRLDEQQAGHGLGLAIVEDLVNDYAGRLVLGKSASLGGLEVNVSLPLTRVDPS